MVQLNSALANVMCLDSRDESTSRCDTSGLVIKFLSKYYGLKCVGKATTCRRIERIEKNTDSAEPSKLHYVQTNDSHDESKRRSIW